MSGMVGLAPKWVRLAPNGITPGLFQIRFQCIWHKLDLVFILGPGVINIQTVMSLNDSDRL